MAAQPRALDVSTGVGAAYTAKLLAEVGWDVVKAEPPGGDPLRVAESRWGEGRGGAFAFVNQGKRSAVVSEQQLQELAAAADVVVGDFSRSGLAEAELPSDAYHRLPARQAVVSVTPFGLTGPKSDWVATDLIIQAASGLMFLTGEWDQPPMQLPPYQGALTGGLAAAAATLAAVRSSRSDGRRHHVDVSMVEAFASNLYGQVSSYVVRGEVPRREQRIKAGFRMVPAKDRFVYCAPGAVANMRMDGIAKLVNEPQLAEERFQTAEGRMQHWDEFVELFVPPFREKTAQEWFESAEQMRMTFALVQTIDDLFACPHLAARELFREVPVPQGGTLRVPGRPFRIEGGPDQQVGPAPAEPGEDTDEVIADWLGQSN